MKTEHNETTRSTVNAHDGQTTADTFPVWKSPKLPVCTCDRKRALADGLQKEVPTAYLEKLHADWDMLLPRRVFLTRKVIECCKIPDGLCGTEEKSRLWDVLNILEVAIGNSPEERIPFPVTFGGRAGPVVWLHAVWSTADIDDPTPSITVMSPEEG